MHEQLPARTAGGYLDRFRIKPDLRGMLKRPRFPEIRPPREALVVDDC